MLDIHTAKCPTISNNFIETTSKEDKDYQNFDDKEI